MNSSTPAITEYITFVVHSSTSRMSAPQCKLLAFGPTLPREPPVGRDVSSGRQGRARVRHCRRALLQHGRAGRSRDSLSHPAADAVRSGRRPAAYRTAQVLRPARPAPDRQDLRAARADGRAERQREVSVRLRERRDWPVGPRGRGERPCVPSSANWPPRRSTS